jgi:hypothetical protein
MNKKMLGRGGFTHLRKRDNNIIRLREVCELTPNKPFFIFIPPLSRGYLEVGVWHN